MRGLFKNGVNENIDAVSTYVKLVAFHSKTPCTALSNKMEATQRLFFYCEINSIPKIFRENDFTKKNWGLFRNEVSENIDAVSRSGCALHSKTSSTAFPTKWRPHEGRFFTDYLYSTILSLYILLLEYTISCCNSFLSTVFRNPPPQC